MKLPGLESILDNMSAMWDDMVPLLERIADGVDELVRLQSDIKDEDG